MSTVAKAVPYTTVVHSAGLAIHNSKLSLVMLTTNAAEPTEMWSQSELTWRKHIDYITKKATRSTMISIDNVGM